MSFEVAESTTLPANRATRRLGKMTLHATCVTLAGGERVELLTHTHEYSGVLDFQLQVTAAGVLHVPDEHCQVGPLSWWIWTWLGWWRFAFAATCPVPLPGSSFFYHQELLPEFAVYHCLKKLVTDLVVRILEITKLGLVA